MALFFENNSTAKWYAYLFSRQEQRQQHRQRRWWWTSCGTATTKEETNPSVHEKKQFFSKTVEMLKFLSTRFNNIQQIAPKKLKAVEHIEGTRSTKKKKHEHGMQNEGSILKCVGYDCMAVCNNSAGTKASKNICIWSKMEWTAWNGHFRLTSGQRESRN